MSVPNAAKTRRERRIEERLARRDQPRLRRAQEKRRINLGLLSLVAVVAGLVVIAIAIAFGGKEAVPTTTLQVAVATAPTGIPTEGYVLGKADAPVTIDLYEDFQCPACESWGQNVFPRLAANELADGTAKIVFHQMAFLGDESVGAAKAAYAAGQQDRFWDMWATLYANQGKENSGAFNRDRLVAMAERLGLDVARFEADMDAAEAAAAVSASDGAASSAGVRSTPTLVVAGQAFVGIHPYPDISAAIAAAAASGSAR